MDPDLLLSVFNWHSGSLLFYQRFKEIEQGHVFETVSFHRIWKQVKIYCLLHNCTTPTVIVGIEVPSCLGQRLYTACWSRLSWTGWKCLRMISASWPVWPGTTASCN
jgi:hypothetical protein